MLATSYEYICLKSTCKLSLALFSHYNDFLCTVSQNDEFFNVQTYNHFLIIRLSIQNRHHSNNNFGVGGQLLSVNSNNCDGAQVVTNPPVSKNLNSSLRDTSNSNPLHHQITSFPTHITHNSSSQRCLQDP